MTDPGARRPRISVVVPALDAATTLGECLRALAEQSYPTELRETIVVVDARTSDATASIARQSGARVLLHSREGAASARNAGVAIATGKWIAFTDADCVPTRRWLEELLNTCEASQGLGAAGPTSGLSSVTPAARFVDLTGGLDAERHLAHDTYPWAPTCNVMYRREALVSVGGFDERFESYEGCDLHTRLRREVGGAFSFVRRAVVLHRHRASWRAYWRQQVNYGRGFAQFFLRYGDELPWRPADELRAWTRVASAAVRALISVRGNDALLRRGLFVKSLAQRIGFVATFWRPNAAARWRREPRADISAAQ